MVSVIVCSKFGPQTDSIHQRNVTKTASGDIDYICINNSAGAYGLCAAYNTGVKQARGDILVFMHEDVFFMEPGWDVVLADKFRDPAVGLVGVAGTQYLFPNPPGWVVAGRPFIKGKVIHETGGGEKFHLTVFSWEKTDADVVAVDGLFFAVRKELFSRVAFDQTLFDGFHFYDLDLCMQVRTTHRIIVTPDILVKHQSGGAFNEIWHTYAARFVEKYRSSLPASCVEEIPDRLNRIPFENYDIKGKVRQTTIA